MNHQLIIVWGSAIFIVILVIILRQASPLPFIYVLTITGIPHDLSMIKHAMASVHYLFSTVQNLRKNLSDTRAMLVMIDMTFKSMNAHEVSTWRANMYTSSCYKCPLLHSHCSLLASQIFLVSIPSPFHLFRCFPIRYEPVLLPPTSKTSLRIHSTRAMDSSISHSTYTCQDSNLLG